MFTRIQALRFRCLRSVDQELGRFMTLVGPNASGKTTFLDVIALLGDLMRNGGKVADTVLERSADFEKLLSDVARNDRDNMMTQTYLTSDTGKVYTMLAHASGRFGRD